ncbi:cysteine desulfurase family protein [Novibacillus thermophilus]|uniref:cysteine desulfurase n=1 Tax=Novibacillus thermophilus TaxID=1471761 RepID=A0A1U9K5E3_9BACL|nr:cysteine desulfurase family protein [Novibacillus thermophilus]AQS55246.1 cysteine desulfurase NifS [Novibacillus thermophilus]
MAVYLDHAATTPVHPDVREAMLPFLGSEFGNPSSIHRFGRDVRSAIDEARDAVATGLNTEAKRIVFTSGGTEADNLAVIGAAVANRDKGQHVITTAVEHHAVLEACHYLEEIGFNLTYVPVDETGLVHVQTIQEAITDETTLISVMFGNNEVGTVQPIAEIGRLAREHGIILHTDAVQAFGVVPIDVSALPVDLLSVSAHKINGPKGVGALYVRQDVPFTPRLFGGSQERKRRPGTENVPGIVGFGKAVEIVQNELGDKSKTLFKLRQAMVDVWEASGIEFVINGNTHACLPHILNVSFIGVDTESMLMNLDLEGVACSSGSACTAGSLEVSHVLKAMQLPEDVTASAVRFSFGLGNTVEEVQSAAETAVKIAKRLR